MPSTMVCCSILFQCKHSVVERLTKQSMPIQQMAMGFGRIRFSSLTRSWRPRGGGALRKSDVRHQTSTNKNCSLLSVCERSLVQLPVHLSFKAFTSSSSHFSPHNVPSLPPLFLSCPIFAHKSGEKSSLVWINQ